jgi:hypothetical protein
MPLRLFRTPTLLALALAAGACLAQAPQGVPTLSPPLGGNSPAPRPATAPAATPAPSSGFREIKWDELVPPNWDPMKELKGLDFAQLSDADPRAIQMMKKLREVWDNAPANPKMDGQAVRIPGFVVPLEEGKDGLKEFLLVPYFGACVHSPPPPANQIIHVQSAAPVKGVRSMDAVWINGTISREKTDSYMGVSSYRLQARAVEPYVEKPR